VRLELADRFFVLVLLGTSHDNVSAGLGESVGHAKADAAISTGD